MGLKDSLGLTGGVGLNVVINSFLKKEKVKKHALHIGKFNDLFLAA